MLNSPRLWQGEMHRKAEVIGRETGIFVYHKARSYFLNLRKPTETYIMELSQGRMTRALFTF